MKILKKWTLTAFVAALSGFSLLAQNKTGALQFVDKTLIKPPGSYERITALDIKNSMNRIINFADSIGLDVSKAKRVATYAELDALPAPTKSTVYRVTNDEKRNYKNTLYIWWDDGKRQWFPAIDDN